MRSSLPALALVALVAVAGCLGGPTGDGPPTARGANDAGSTPNAQTTSRATTTATGTTELTCALDRDRLRGIAVERVANETATDPGDVRVLNDAVVSYDVLDECFYHAKVHSADDDEVLGVFVAANGTVVDREAVERRADRAYRQRYGKLGVDLREHLRSTDADERVAVRVALTGIDRDAARAAVDGNGTDAAYRRALEAAVERRVERKTATVVRRLRGTDGVTVESDGPLVVTTTATPSAIQRMERLDSVRRLSLLRADTTTRVPQGGDG